MERWGEMGTDEKFTFFQNHQSAFAQRDSLDKYQKRPLCPLGSVPLVPHWNV